jgi:5-methylcytosine-specific restriction endonuclease McrA
MTKFCPKCQAETERNTKGTCRLCAKLSTAAWRAANPDKAKADNLAWYSANPEKAKAARLARYAANPKKWRVRSATWSANNADKVKAYVAKWRVKNLALCRLYKQNRRARKLANGGALSKGLSAKLFKLQRGKCPCCKKPLGENYHLDHIVPLALGGGNVDSNIQLLRAFCNLKKHAKDPFDWANENGRLL